MRTVRSTRPSRPVRASRPGRRLPTRPNETARAREQREALERLKEWVKKGDTLYTVLRHVAPSGTSRNIDIYKFKKCDRHGRVEKFYLSVNVAQALGWPMAKDDNGIKVGGAAEDMGYHLVHVLAQKMFGEGYALKHDWI